MCIKKKIVENRRKKLALETMDMLIGLSNDYNNNFVTTEEYAEMIEKHIATYEAEYEMQDY